MWPGRAPVVLEVVESPRPEGAGILRLVAAAANEAGAGCRTGRGVDAHPKPEAVQVGAQLPETPELLVRLESSSAIPVALPAVVDVYRGPAPGGEARINEHRRRAPDVVLGHSRTERVPAVPAEWRRQADLVADDE